MWNLRYEIILILLVITGEFESLEVSSALKEDKLQVFYDRLKQPDVTYCKDKTRLLPDCTACIPGLQQAVGSDICNTYVKESVDIRDEIGKLTSDRYGVAVLTSSRPFGLYPYLEGSDFIIRQQIFGTMLSEQKAMNILDIGAYYNPINLFLSKDFCPASVVVVEPILDALSAMVPCGAGAGSTHFIFLPITFKFYLKVKAAVPRSDSVVCIGCDSHYGPNRALLETSFQKPYKLFLEYPSEYVHNMAFKKMMGHGKGESMTFIKKFQPKTNETQYTKRVMKVIEYVAV